MHNVIKFLSTEMNRPSSYGLFHLIWISMTIACIVIIFYKRNTYNEKQLNKVLRFYGYIALILELIKQIIWSYNLNDMTWSYNWYSAPFQLCTTPIYASLLASYTKNKKLKNSLLSYIGYFTILGSIATFLYPETCFTKTIEVNIHTMFLHCGSLALSIYLLANNIKKNSKSFKSALYSFASFELIAFILDIVIYNTITLGDDTFNMFYISPYYISPLPVFNIIQKNVVYIVFLIIYNLVFLIGSFIVYKISRIKK